MKTWKDTSQFLNSCDHLFLRNCHGPISCLVMFMLIFLFFCLAQYFFLSHNIPLILEFSVTQVIEITFPFFITKKKKKIPHFWTMLDVHCGLLLTILNQLTSSSVRRRKEIKRCNAVLKTVSQITRFPEIAELTRGEGFPLLVPQPAAREPLDDGTCSQGKCAGITESLCNRQCHLKLVWKFLCANSLADKPAKLYVLSHEG